MSNSNETSTPMSAAGFLSTMGTDTHMAYTDGEYANVTQVIGDLEYLGIDQVRDGISNGVDANGNYNGSAPLSTYLEMAQAGIKFTFIIEATSEAYIQSELALISQVEATVRGSVLAIEGPNEIDNDPITFNGLTGQVAGIAAQQALYQAVQSDTALIGVPVVYFTGYTPGSADPNTTAGLANFDNQHPYPNFGEAPAFWVSRAQALTNLTSADVATAPAVYTETGYSTNQVYADVQQVYTLDLMMDTAHEGISRTYLYDLLDAYAPGSPQGDDGFGLFDYTTAAKPAAAAVHNLTTLLQDSGPGAATFTPTALTYSITGLPADGNSMVLEKSNGTYVFAIWAEPEIFNVNTIEESAPPGETVTVTLPQYFASIQVFDPTIATSAIASYTNANSVAITVTDHPILIELGAATSAPIMTPAPTPDTLTLNVSEDAYLGDAQFTLSVDGVQIGGVQTTTALKSNNQTQNITLTGGFGSGSHTIAVDFLNDLYGGSPTTDRNLYVNAITLDGLTTTEDSSQLSTGTVDYTVLSGTTITTTPVSVSVASQVLAKDTGASSTDNITSDGAVTLTGTVTGAAGTAVEIYNGTAALAAAAVSNGVWTYAVTLAAGTYNLSAVATDPTGDSASTSAEPAIIVETAAPTVTITAPAQLANSTVVTLSGTVLGASGTTVGIFNGTAALGAAAISNGTWTYTSGSLSAGSYSFDAIATDPAGNKATAADAAFQVTAPALSITYSAGVDTSTTTRTVSNTAPVSMTSATGADTIVLKMAEDAYLGDAQFTVSINGTQIGGTQTATALHSAGLSQAFSMAGNFGSGPLTVAVDFLNDAFALYSNGTLAGDRNLYVDSITVNGVTTVENGDQNLQGTATYAVAVPAGTTTPVTVSIASQVLAKDTGASSTDNITSDGAVTLTGTVTGAAGTAVEIYNGTAALAAAAVSNGVWTYAVTLAAGTYNLSAVATDPTGDSASTSAEPAIIVETAAPTVTITAPAQLTNSTVVTLSGTVLGASGTTVEIFNGTAALGAAAISNGTWTYTSGSLSAGSYSFDAIATDLAGNKATAADAAFQVTAPALSITYSAGVDTSTTTRTVSNTAPVSMTSATGADTIVLKMAEDAYLGDAQFTVSINGTQIGGTQTATALHSAGLSQAFSMAGNFGSGPLTVAVDFLNDAFALYSNGTLAGDRNLYVDSITVNGVTTVENGDQNLQGTATYAVAVPAGTTTPVSVSVASQVLAKDTGASSTDNITSDGAVTLTGTVTGAAGTAVEIYNGTAALAAAAVSNGVWTYAVTLAAGTYNLSAVATDPTGDSASTSAEPAIIVETAAPTVTITAPAQLANSTVVTLSGTVLGASGTTVGIFNGTAALGAAAISNGTWTYTSGSLSAGSYSFDAIATDPAGNKATAADAAFQVTAPALSITYSAGVDTSTTTRTVSNTAPVSMTSATGADTIVLKMAEDAYLGDAQFTVSINGTQIGGTQTATALHSAGLSQAFSMAGNFGSGPLTVAVDFLNDAFALYSNGTLAGDRNLYVDSITVNGVTTVENGDQNLQGTATYAVAVPAGTTTPVTVSIASQVLAKDTGASSTDNITSDGAVTLTGTVTGAAGTAVEIYNGTAALAAAAVSNGVWTYAVTLAAGTYNLSAVATDPTGDSASTSAEPAIIVETAAPTVTITAPAQLTNSTVVTLSGTVLGASGTTVEIFNGTAALGAAAISNGTWTYTSGSLSAGSYSFDAIATDLAGNKATAADAAFQLTAPAASADEVSATVSTGSGLAQLEVDLTSTVPIAGTYVPVSTTGIGTNPLVLFNWDPASQLTSFMAAIAAGDASIVDEGDSTTLGYGSAASGFRELSYSTEMAQSLTKDGVAAQSDNFLGLGNEGSDIVDERLTLIGTAVGNFPFDAGGQIIETQVAGDGFDFTLNSPGNYNRLTVSYVDAGTGIDTVSVVLASGAVTVLGEINFSNTGNTLKQSFNFTPGAYNEMILTQNGSAATYIQGASFWSTTSPAVQVEDAGIGGETAEGANTSSVYYTSYTGSTLGAGATAGVAALNPSLAIVDFGINDIDDSSYNGETVAKMVSSYEQIVTTLKTAGSDVIMMLPAPWSSPYLSGSSGETYYQQDFPAVLAALEAFSVNDNLPLINLSAAYGNNYTNLVAAGLLSSDNLHPDATLYADIGSQLAGLLTNATSGALSSGGDYTTESTVKNNATISGAAPVNTLAGTGMNDTYVMNAADQSDTIINGSAGSTAASGVLDINAANHNQLWFEKSGNNLVIDVMGTNAQAIIQNWYGSNGAQLQDFTGSDGYSLTTANVQALVQAMASFSAANTAFNPPSTTNTNLTSSYYTSVLTAAVANAWHA